MVNLGAYQPLPQNSYCYHKLFLQLFAPVYIDMTADSNHSSAPNLHVAYFITSLVTLSKSQIELLSFSSEVLLHQSYCRNRVNGYFTFRKTKLHIICFNILPKSVFEDPSHDFYSMFQQCNSSVRFTLHWIPFPFVNW